MATIELITGHSGHGHVSGDDWRHLNAGIFGEGTYYLGDAPTVSMASANVLQIANCEIMAQGAHVRITDGPLELAIANGTQGYQRKDLVCIHYEKDSVTGVEEATFIVVEGTPALTAAGAADPETDYMDNSILDGALVVDIPIIRIVLDGITPSAASIIGEATSLAKARDSLSRATGIISISAPVGESLHPITYSFDKPPLVFVSTYGLRGSLGNVFFGTIDRTKND